MVECLEVALLVKLAEDVVDVFGNRLEPLPYLLIHRFVGIFCLLKFVDQCDGFPPEAPGRCPDGGVVPGRVGNWVIEFEIGFEFFGGYWLGPVESI